MHERRNTKATFLSVGLSNTHTQLAEALRCITIRHFLKSYVLLFSIYL